MSQQSHVWSPIEDLPADWIALRDDSIEALMEVWREGAQDLRQSRAYVDFLERLRRQWAIETGILERLYALSDGAAKTLIEKGLDAALVGHEDTDRNPSDVLAIIRDQHFAIEGLYACVSGERPLGKSFILELHQILTDHQDFYDARDTLGQPVRRPLPKGQWKTLPNNVEGPDGFVFEFCPPEHVVSEVDALLRMHESHQSEQVPIYIESAWIHHRFTLIHPLTDGNGRVARCLATLVFLQREWFPLVVTRTDREEYLRALRQADQGELRGLVQLFITLQQRAVFQAFSLSRDLAMRSDRESAILEAVRHRLEQNQQERVTVHERLSKTADTLHAAVKERLSRLVAEVQEAIRVGDLAFDAYCAAAERNSERSGYNNFQIVACAQKLGYFANRDIYRAWAKLTIVTDTKSEILIAFHGMGTGATGVLACSAMYYTKPIADEGEKMIGEVNPLSDEPFTFTYTEDPAEVKRRFEDWLNDRIILGLDQWRKDMGA